MIFNEHQCGICGDLEQLQPQMSAAEVCTSTALCLPGMSRVELSRRVQARHRFRYNQREPINNIGKN